MPLAVPLTLVVLMGSLVSTVSEGSQWKCPEFNSTDLCLCDFPQTLTCSTNLVQMKEIGDRLRSLPADAAVSLLACTIQNVTYLPGRLFEGISLHGLVLTSGELVNVSEDAFVGLTTPLQALGLPNNRLGSVPTTALHSLRHLDRLDLSYNKITAVDSDSFVGLEHLNILDLSNNRIVNVSSGAFSTLSNLTVLKLENNELTVARVSALIKLDSLEDLDLSTNDLKGPLEPGILPVITALKSLSLAKNQFGSISAGALAGVPNLQSLNLNHNQIDVLEDDAFQALSSLRSLYLSNNRIVAVSGSSLAHLNHLTELDLSHNFLRALTPDLVAPLTHLRILRLDDNDISIVEADTFERNSSLNRLTLSDNPFNCDCSLVDFAVWLNESRLEPADRNTAVCMTPLHLENALVAEVPATEFRCEEDDYDLLMQEGPSATHISGSQIVLRAFNFNGSNITLLWSIDTKARSFSCDALFVYEEMSSHEVLLTSTPLRCNSSEMADPTTLVVRLDLGTMQPFHRYRFCVVLLEDDKFTDEMQLVLGCSEIIPLIVTNHSVPQSQGPNAQTRIASVQANMSMDTLSISVDMWNPKRGTDQSRCRVTVTVFMLGSLLARHGLNCTNPQISISGLPPGRYQVCASLDQVPAASERLHCVQVKDQMKPEATIWFTVCFILVSTFAFLVLYFVYRKLASRRSRLKTTHQCFLGSNEFDDQQKQHSRYVKLQTVN